MPFFYSAKGCTLSVPDRQEIATPTRMLKMHHVCHGIVLDSSLREPPPLNPPTQMHLR